MSDEPKKRSRASIGWTLLASLVLYPLSTGPADWIHMRTVRGTAAGDACDCLWRNAYYPLCLVLEHYDPAARVMEKYEHWWITLGL
jgi:hypothetical protein